MDEQSHLALTLASGLVGQLPGELAELVKVLAGVRDIHETLGQLDDARVLVDRAQKKTSMAEATRKLKESSVTPSTVNSITSHAMFAQAAHVHQWAETSIQARDAVLQSLGRARLSAAKAQMVAAVDELKLIAGGGTQGASWKEGLGPEDWAGVKQKSQQLFEDYSADACKKARDKVEKTKRAYLKEAQDMGISTEEKKRDSQAAEDELGRETRTAVEFTLLAAVLDGGVDGSDTCNAQIEEMLQSNISTSDIHPALWAEVEKLVRA